MAVKHLEIERKYDAAADFGLPDLSGLPGVASIAGPRTHGLHATYFDTADLRLAAHGITLRRRRGGDDAGWHLKIPAGPDSKQELRAPLGRARIVPARLASLVAAYTRGEPLLPVATLETERTVVRLLDASGETLAEVADDAVSGRDLRGAARVTAPPEVTGQTMPFSSRPFSSRPTASGTTANDAGADADGLVSRAPGEPGSVANTGNANGIVTVIDADGTGVVPAGVSVGEAPAPAAAWREIEVELVAGTQELLKAAGKRLRKAGASRAGSSSKLGRLLNDAIEPPPATAARADAEERIGAANGSGPSAKSRSDKTRSTSAPTTGDAVVAYLAAQVEAILRYDPKARLAEHDAVHRMRVAVRRTRSALQSYRPVLDRERTDPLGPELKWLAAELGAVRDLEVLRMRFAERWLALAPAEAGAEPAWLAEIAERERSAYRGLNAALKEPRYFALLDALDRLAADPPLAGRASGRKARKELPGLVERAWRRLERTYATIGEASDAGVAGLAGVAGDPAGAAGAGDPDTARHDTRKAAKRARYAAELAVPVLGAPASAVARNAKRLQETLGGYQDGVIAMEHLRAASARTRDAAGSFALGVLYGVEHCEAERARDALPGVWESLDRPAF